MNNASITRIEIEQKSRAIGLEPIPSDEVVLLAPLPSFWEAFQDSPFFADHQANPLDRFSKSIINPLAKSLNCEAEFPSDGPPFPPFISWASNAEGIYHSPIGLLVHDQFGLWISFRGALKISGIEKIGRVDPCQNCARPCQKACPVSAFSGGNYDVEKCKEHLQNPNADCWKGCLARQICPANHIPRHSDQSRFHMRAFVG